MREREGERDKSGLPETHSIEAAAPRVDLQFHSNPKDPVHKEDPQEAAPASSVFSLAGSQKIT